MKRFFALLVLLSMTGMAVFAELPERKFNNLPQGTFKKKKDGTIVQYNEKGKKIGTYKLDSNIGKKLR